MMLADSEAVVLALHSKLEGSRDTLTHKVGDVRIIAEGRIGIIIILTTFVQSLYGEDTIALGFGELQAAKVGR